MKHIYAQVKNLQFLIQSILFISVLFVGAYFIFTPNSSSAEVVTSAADSGAISAYAASGLKLGGNYVMQTKGYKMNFDNRVPSTLTASREPVMVMTHETDVCNQKKSFNDCLSSPALKLFVNSPKLPKNDWTAKGLQEAALLPHNTHTSGIYIHSFGKGAVVSDRKGTTIAPSGIHLEPHGAHQGLRVDGSANSGDNIRVDTSVGGTGLAIYGGSKPSPYCNALGYDCTKTTLIRLAGGDVVSSPDVNFGFGLYPAPVQERVDINGAIQLRTAGGVGINGRVKLEAAFEEGGSNYGGGLSIKTRSTQNVYNEAMRVAGSGNVGIGNAKPQYKLDVTGNMRVTGQAYTATGNGSFTVLSDERFKNVRGAFDRGLDDLLKVDTIRYNYTPNNPLGSDTSSEYVGVTAQNLQVAIPEAVSEEKGYLAVNTSPVLWTVVNAIKELNKKFMSMLTVQNSQSNEIESLKTENARMKSWICKQDPAAEVCK